MKELTDDELVDIGAELESAGFLNSESIAVPAGEISDRVRRIVIAVTFFERWWPNIHPHCCEGSQVAPVIQDSMDAGATLADVLLAAHGLPIPAASLAKILMKHGIGRLCASMLLPPVEAQV